jgi:BASS family bile acid:Na+ symporter
MVGCCYANSFNGGVALIVAIIVAAGRESLLNIGLMLIVVVLILNIGGYILGYWFGRLFKMSERNSRTIAITVGMQNAGLISGIAKVMGKIATIGLAPAICGPLMGLTSSILASYWNKNLPTEDSKFSKEEPVGNLS